MAIQRFMSMKNARRWPRRGKIKIGTKKKNAKGVEYPVALDHFVCDDPDFMKAFGDAPKEIPIMFPGNDWNALFVCEMKKYGKIGLKCKGDGQTGYFMQKGELVERECDPEDPWCQDCQPVGTLNFLIPELPGFGTWQVRTSGWNSFVNLNSAYDMISNMTGGKISYIPLKLRITPHNAIVHKDDKQFQKEVYVLILDIADTPGKFFQRYSLEAQQQRLLQDPNHVHIASVAQKFTQALPLESEPDAVEVDPDEDEAEAYEESYPTELSQPIQPPNKPVNKQDKAPARYVCSICGGSMTKAQKTLSEKKYGKLLCPKCQDRQSNDINWPGFWSTCNKLGLSRDEVHEYARTQYFCPEMKSLTEIFETQEELDLFLDQLRTISEEKKGA